MTAAVEAVRSMVPALAFLCVGVPLAALLDQLGFFDAVAASIAVRWPAIPVGALWLLAAATTAVLNLDTTVVLLTPLYLRLARRAGVDPLPLAAVPLLLAAFASSVLPVSNLTTLIAAERLQLGVGDVLTHLAPVSVAASAVGWLAYRRVHPRRLPAVVDLAPMDERAAARARRIGGGAVAVLLAGFVLGPSIGLAPWMVALAVDVVLALVLRSWPWRDVPILTAAGVAALAAVTAAAVPATRLGGALGHDEPVALFGLVLGATAAANVVNNLPALLVALDATPVVANAPVPWGIWAWLAGVNTGAVLLPIGALANILWWRILRDEGISLSWGRYARLVAPVAVPALLAGALTMALVRVAFG